MSRDSDLVSTQLMTIDNEWDWDGDGLSDYEEETFYNTDPMLIDTDGDNFLDGNEILLNTDPTDPENYPSVPSQWFMSLNTLIEQNASILENVIQHSEGNDTEIRAVNFAVN